MVTGAKALPTSVVSWPPAHRIEGDMTEVRMPTPPTYTSALPVPPALPLTPTPTTPPQVVLTADRAPVMSNPPPLPATARKMVLGLCSGLVRHVEASLDQDNKLTLHVYSAPGAEQELKTRLSQAFASYNGMHIQIHMAP
jgi:hypothetical protein